MSKRHSSDYDLIFCLRNYGDGPESARQRASDSAIAGHQQVLSTLTVLAERFDSADQNGPHAYATFLDNGDVDETARLR